MLSDLLATALRACAFPRAVAVLGLGVVASQSALLAADDRAESLVELALAPTMARADPAAIPPADAQGPSELGRHRQLGRRWRSRHAGFGRLVPMQVAFAGGAALISAPADQAPEQGRAAERLPAPAMPPLDPFNAYVPPRLAPEMELEEASLDGYLFAAYRRAPEKRDSSGDFTWKDPAAAERLGLSLDAYVIGGMDPDFKELVYAAGKSMDAAGIKWTMLSAFRDDWRQEIASGFKASTGNSCHGGSRAVGGYGHGRCADLWTMDGPVGALFSWIDRMGRRFGLLRPMPGADPAHVATVGDWRTIAQRLRAERLTATEVAAVRDLAGSDTMNGLSELARAAEEPPASTPPDPAASTRLAADLPIRLAAASLTAEALAQAAPHPRRRFAGKAGSAAKPRSREARRAEEKKQPARAAARHGSERERGRQAS